MTETMSALRDPMARIRGAMAEKVIQLGLWIVARELVVSLGRAGKIWRSLEWCKWEAT